MQIKTDTPDVGVIVGRFQVHELHSEHKALINIVCAEHDKVVILLGLSPLMNSITDPLDFESRKQMILEEFPDVNVLYIKDVVSDAVWSKKLDEIVGDLLHANQTALLYGSRDSFIKHYEGRFPTKILEADKIISGTVLRKGIASARTKATKAFREGVIWASQARFATCYPTVDIAPLRFNKFTNDGPEFPEVLLGKKPGEDRYRFIGGFVDPRFDKSFDDAAHRETREEANITLRDLRNIGSALIDDWRYRGTPDGIITTLFVGDHADGIPTAGDDLAEVKWFGVHDLEKSDIMDAHGPLLDLLLEAI